MSEERIEDLLLDNLKIIQKTDNFRFGTDSILLSLFVSLKGGEKILDIGTGTGIIPILLSYKNKDVRINGLEIQEDIADMARRSIALNSLNDRITIKQGDAKEILAYYPSLSFDIVVCNPPYKKRGTGLLNQDGGNAIARHEIACSQDDIIKAASLTLKVKGSFYMINRPDRLADTLVSMRRYKIEPRRLKFIHTDIKKEPILFLIKGILQGGENLRVESPYIIDQEMTTRILKEKKDI